MKNDYSRFGSALLIVIISLVLIDISIGVVSDKTMQHLPDYSGILAKDNYRLHRLETDIVIIGSSRGSHHYVTKQLNDSIDTYLGQHYSLYNAAIEGLYANSNSCAAEVIVSRYHPNLVIYDLSESQLRYVGIKDIEFSSPYYWSDTIVRRYLDNIGLKERTLMKSGMYRYNRKHLSIGVNFLRPIPEDDGYVPLYGTTIDTTLLQTESKRNSEDSMNGYSRQNFINVLERYKSAHVPLVIVCSPQFRPTSNNQELKHICDSLGVPFLDFFDSPYFNTRPELFRDISHLNDEGAHEYTALFFEQLKKHLDLIE